MISEKIRNELNNNSDEELKKEWKEISEILKKNEEEMAVYHQTRDILYVELHKRGINLPWCAECGEREIDVPDIEGMKKMKEGGENAK